MPTIKKEDKQLQALEEITEDLAEMGMLNGALKGTFAISVVIEQNSKKTMKVPLEEKDAQRVRAVVQARRLRLVKRIRMKAEKFRIELSDEEQAMLDDAQESEATGAAEDSPSDNRTDSPPPGYIGEEETPL